MFKKYHKNTYVIVLGTTLDGDYIVCNGTENTETATAFNNVWIVPKSVFESTYVEDVTAVPVPVDTAPATVEDVVTVAAPESVAKVF